MPARESLNLTAVIRGMHESGGHLDVAKKCKNMVKTM